jgi:methylthioribose-1-phosphate isomerase
MNVTVRGRRQSFRTVTFDAAANSVRLIEQRLLPHEFRIVAAKNFRETARAVRDMVGRDWSDGGIWTGPGGAGFSRR